MLKHWIGAACAYWSDFYENILISAKLDNQSKAESFKIEMKKTQKRQ